MRTPRSRYLRRRHYTRTRYNALMLAFLAARASDLAATGTAKNFTAAIAQATGILTLAGNAVAGLFAGETLTFAGNAGDTETITIGSKVYTFQTVLTNVDGNVLIGGTASESLDNLIAAINLDAGAGTLYATAMTEHPTVSAAAGVGDTMDVTAKLAGVAGNSIAVASTVTGGTWGGATLSGGVDNETVTIGARVYTFTDPLIDSANNVLIGATASDTLDNLIAAINGTAGAGTLYGTGTVAHADVSAAAGTGDTMDVTHLDGGIAGNSIATTETMVNGSWGDVTLTGGSESNSLTITTHGYAVGDGPFVVSQVGGALPDGLSVDELYWVKSVVDANNITLTTVRGGPVTTILSEGSGTLSATKAESAEAIFEYLRTNPPEVVRDATDVDNL